MGNRVFRFVAHVGEAKGLAFDFAVAWVDDEVMFFAELSRQIDNIDAFVIFHAGERL